MICSILCVELAEIPTQEIKKKKKKFTILHTHTHTQLLDFYL